eukprot:scaffold3032_cov375-Prasinococcus_capsulatus_cf.AAC.14
MTGCWHATAPSTSCTPPTGRQAPTTPSLPRCAAARLMRPAAAALGSSCAPATTPAVSRPVLTERRVGVARRAGSPSTPPPSAS